MNIVKDNACVVLGYIRSWIIWWDLKKDSSAKIEDTVIIDLP